MTFPISRPLAVLAGMLLAPGAAGAMTPEGLFAKVSPAIWVVRAQHGDSANFSLGSAVAIAPNLLVTACHVVNDATAVTIARDKGSRVVKIDTVTHDPDKARDLCLLTAHEAVTAGPVGIAPIKSVKVGETVYAIGSPLGLELSLTNGLVSALRVAPNETLPDIQTTAAIAPGSSGGGLFDEDGLLIGVTVAIASKETDNLAFAYPAQWVMEMPVRVKMARDQWAQVMTANGVTLDAGGQPTGSGFAPIDDIAAVPAGAIPAAGVDEAYKQFLLRDKPRAFVITSDNRWGVVSDAGALNDLFKDCAARKVQCRLYAVDDTVVWRPDKPGPVPVAAAASGTTAPAR